LAKMTLVPDPAYYWARYATSVPKVMMPHAQDIDSATTETAGRTFVGH
jgi:hypothetical protein